MSVLNLKAALSSVYRNICNFVFINNFPGPEQIPQLGALMEFIPECTINSSPLTYTLARIYSAKVFRWHQSRFMPKQLIAIWQETYFTNAHAIYAFIIKYQQNVPTICDGQLVHLIWYDFHMTNYDVCVLRDETKEVKASSFMSMKCSEFNGIGAGTIGILILTTTKLAYFMLYVYICSIESHWFDCCDVTCFRITLLKRYF